MKILNRATGKMETQASMMSDIEVLGYRGRPMIEGAECTSDWPAHLSVEQMRASIVWWQSPDFKRVS